MVEKNAAAIPWLRSLHAKGALVAGVCTGVAILAEAGLLEGRRATTHWAVADDFRQRFPEVDWQPQLCVTEDRGVLCGGGVYASIDLALYIVEKLCGRDIAMGCAKSLVVQMPRTYQTSFAFFRSAAITAMPLSATARNGCTITSRTTSTSTNWPRIWRISPRTFLRRFKAATGQTPLAYLQRLRTAAAKRMLEEDRMTIQEVGFAVEYEDVAFFRDLFKRHEGLSPGAYRERYGRSIQPTAA